MVNTQTNKSNKGKTETLKKTYLIAAGVMAIYLGVMFGVFPPIYSNAPIGIPKPSLEVASPQQVKLGDSFQFVISTNNLGADADLQSVTVEFPQNQNLDNIKITSYDFLQSPKLFLQGQEIGSGYYGNQNLVKSQYPFIEAYNRPSKAGHSSSMTLEITPTEVGVFTIYIKTVAMPHVSEKSHFPQQGPIDHQNEFVQEHKIMVVP